MPMNQSLDRVFAPPDPSTTPREICNYNDAVGLTFQTPTSVFVKTDGTCPSNTSVNSKASYGIYFGHNSPFNRCALVPRNEEQTTNVAELYAIRTALRIFFASISPEPPPYSNVKDLIIVTNSTYIQDVLSKLICGWEQNASQTSNGEAVRNSNLIAKIQHQISTAEKEHAVIIKFWVVSREFVLEAHRLAHVALQNYVHGDFERIVCLPSERWNHAGNYTEKVTWRLRNTNLTLSRLEWPLMGGSQWISSVRSYVIRQLALDSQNSALAFATKLYAHLGQQWLVLLEAEIQILTKEKYDLAAMRLRGGPALANRGTPYYPYIPGDTILRKVLHLDAILKRIDRFAPASMSALVLTRSN